VELKLSAADVAPRADIAVSYRLLSAIDLDRERPVCIVCHVVMKAVWDFVAETIRFLVRPVFWSSAMLCRVNPIAPAVLIDPRASTLCISLAMFNLDRIEQARGSRYSILGISVARVPVFVGLFIRAENRGRQK
jgi:hypothetical protein